MSEGLINELLFCIVILIANIFQGITGFAGTILAMPFGIMLVGYDTARPVLNVLGILAGFSIFIRNEDKVQWKELRRAIAVMMIGIIGGFVLKYYLADQQAILYKILGIFVVVLAVEGLIKSLLAAGQHKKEKAPKQTKKDRKTGTIGGIFLLLGSGLAHGMFVSGGPLLLSYFIRRIKDRQEFRATISTIWILLNTLILIVDVSNDCWTIPMIRSQLVTIPFLVGGMVIGGALCKKMSQKVFWLLTYALLFVAGVSLLFK